MVKLVAVVLVVWGLTFCCVRSRATTTVQVLDTWPSGKTVTLARNQSFYVHLRYASDEPVRIWANPYFLGASAEAGSNPSRKYPAGNGEALGWFFLMNSGAQVDEVRISAGDGSHNDTPVVATYPVRISGSDRPTTSDAQPEWVTRLTADARAAQRADDEKRMNAPTSAGDVALFSGFMLAMMALGVLGLAGPAWGLWRWRGVWRGLAAIPAAVMAFVVLRIAIGTSIDPTSHNLWPFEILMWGSTSAASVAVMMLLRRIIGAAKAGSA